MKKLGTYLGTVNVLKWRRGPDAIISTPKPIGMNHPAVPHTEVKSKGGMAVAAGTILTRESLQKRNDKVFTTAIDSNKAIESEIQRQQEKYPEETIVVSRSDQNKFAEVKTLSNISTELMHIKAVFPFDFFPSELIIEEKRIIINRRQFFMSNTIDTIPILSLLLFEVSHSLFFSSIYIRGGELGAIEVRLKWLKRKEAQRAKELVDGLYMKEKGMVEIREANPQKRLAIIKKLGQADVTS